MKWHYKAGGHFIPVTINDMFYCHDMSYCHIYIIYMEDNATLIAYERL